MSIALERKLKRLSKGLRAQIVTGGRKYTERPNSPVSNFLVKTKKHCNGGKMVDAGLWLREHCASGGKIFLTMSGAGSTFEQGIMISELIRANKIAAISVTGANLEESLYRAVAGTDYAYIPDYQKLTRRQEKELDNAGLRRITDTFLPEEESVRVLLPRLEKLWRKAMREGKRYLWHEYFMQLFAEGISFDSDSRECWLYNAWCESIPVIVPGWEDSTMGNIFTHATYDGDHPFLSQFKLKWPIDLSVAYSTPVYMHRLAEWYMDNTKEKSIAFLQLGGGIAADFPICVVPHLKKDYLYKKSLKFQEAIIRSWAGFVEIDDATMSCGSYSGAAADEKVTWGKLTEDAPGFFISGDYTLAFPDIAALILGW